MLYIIRIFNVYTFGLLLFIASCNEPSPTPEQLDTLDQGIPVRVIKSAGDHWNNDHYLALPFNVAVRNQDTFLILSKQLNEDMKLDVNGLAVAKLKNGSKLSQYILSIPRDSTIQSVRPKSFLDLSTRNSSVVWITEQYLTNHGTQSKWLGWSDESGVEQLLIQDDTEHIE